VERQATPAREIEKPLLPVERAANAQTQHKSTALLRIAMEESPIMGGGAAQLDRDRFEIYKNTQAEMLRSRLCSEQRCGIRRSPSSPRFNASKPTGKGRGVARRPATSQFPGNAEIMAVSVRGDDSKEAAALANTVVDAYMMEVVVAELDRRRHRYSELETAINEKWQEMRTKRRSSSH